MTNRTISLSWAGTRVAFTTLTHLPSGPRTPLCCQLPPNLLPRVWRLRHRLSAVCTVLIDCSRPGHLWGRILGPRWFPEKLRDTFWPTRGVHMKFETQTVDSIISQARADIHDHPSSSIIRHHLPPSSSTFIHPHQSSTIIIQHHPSPPTIAHHHP